MSMRHEFQTDMTAKNKGMDSKIYMQEIAKSLEILGHLLPVRI